MTRHHTPLLPRFGFALLAVVFAFVATYVPQPFSLLQSKTVYAIPVEEVGPSLGLQAKETVETTKSTVENTAQTFFQGVIAKVTSVKWWWESVIKPMGWVLAKAIISSIQRDVVRWINSGFKGSPAFIQDLEGFMVDVADKAAGDFILEYGGPLSIICSPFRLDIQIALGVAYNRSRGKLNRCTLTGAMQNLQNFIGGDFAQGGWDSWLNIVHQPNVYTPVGAGLEATVDMGIRIRNAQGQQITLADWSGGFLSSKVCVGASSPTGGSSSSGSTTAPTQGQQAAEQNCKVTTPGQVIATQLNDTLQLGNQSLVTADEINEVIGAFMQQVVVQTLSGAKGLLGMGGNAAYKDPSFNIDQADPSHPEYKSGMETTIDTSQARYFMAQSLTAADQYIVNAKSIITRYEQSYAPTDEIAARAEAAYNEARALLPGLETKSQTISTALSKLDSSRSVNEKQTAILDFNNLLNSLDTEGTVAEKKVRWEAALDGMLLRDDGTFDRRTITEAITREEAVVDLTAKVIASYRALTNPSQREREIYTEATTYREAAQDNIIALQRILIDYNSGGDARKEAADTYSTLKEQLHSEITTERLHVEWSLLVPTKDDTSYYGSGS